MFAKVAFLCVSLHRFLKNFQVNRALAAKKN